MILKDIDLLIRLHEEATGCEVCNAGGKLEVHHIWAKGIGGGSRLDIEENLIVLCAKRDNSCHDLAQAGKITKRELWGIATERKIHRLRRTA
jgi:hypothetical protein